MHCEEKCVVYADMLGIGEIVSKNREDSHELNNENYPSKPGSEKFKKILSQKRKNFTSLTEVKHIKRELKEYSEDSEPKIPEYHDEDDTSHYLVFSQGGSGIPNTISRSNHQLSENPSYKGECSFKNSKGVCTSFEDHGVFSTFHSIPVLVDGQNPIPHGLCENKKDCFNCRMPCNSLQRFLDFSSSTLHEEKSEHDDSFTSKMEEEFHLRNSAFPVQSGKINAHAINHDSNHIVKRFVHPCHSQKFQKSHQDMVNASRNSFPVSVSTDTPNFNEIENVEASKGISLLESPNVKPLQTTTEERGILAKPRIDHTSGITLYPSTYTEMSYYENDLPFQCLEANSLFKNKSLYSNYDHLSDTDSSLSCESIPSPPKITHSRLSFPSIERLELTGPKFSPAFSAKNNCKTGAPNYCLEKLFPLLLTEEIIDTHCHLDFLFQKERYKGTFKDYKKKNENDFLPCFKGCVTNFIEPSFFTKKQNWENLLKEEDIWGSFGIHPHFSNRYDGMIEQMLKDALKHNKVVAVGEIGLDYSSKNNCDKDLQQQIFKRQLEIAVESKKPVIIHCRDAQEDCLRILTENVPVDMKIHRHCFTGNWTEAQKWMDRFPNLFLGFTSLVTFDSVKHLHQVVKYTPVHRILFETDAPYFVPAKPFEDNRNRRFSHPGMVIHVAAQIAVIKGVKDFPSFLATVRNNTRKMYNI